jgi:hypothetical protein
LFQVKWPNFKAAKLLQVKVVNMRKCILAINMFYIVCVLHVWLPNTRDCNLLKRIQKVTHINIVSSISLDVIFKRINFVIKKRYRYRLFLVCMSFMCNYLEYIYIKRYYYRMSVYPNNLYYLFAKYYKYRGEGVYFCFFLL